MTVLDALVLAGGQGLRLGGVVKAEVPVAGRALLDRALDATAGARRVVVVGPDALARPGVGTTLEDPPAGGPAAGVAAGLRALDAGPAPLADRVLVLACDMPLAAPAVPGLHRALDADPGADGAVLVDADGYPQPLAGVYRADALRAAVRAREADGGVHGCSVRRLVAGLRLVGLEGSADAARDADTWEAVAALERSLTDAGPPGRPGTGEGPG
ncbi:molybdenum cofactor guanylyltransferase [Cellulomonas sp.]|uniref:molybdenum cofactor guanylyltransferase n=1 Tax=Cellulomonas sp. TaxID=40001 RepID=UPI002D37CC72|nr:NTP transferase domain-containing protein [Cellulomonas sp.]HYQ74350.1 NTP transferase domain-containing protein [Cellulomonas sp.]